MSDPQEPSRLAYVACNAVLAMLLGLLVIVSVSGLGILYYGARYADRIYGGITIFGVEVGGLTRREALERLQEWLAEEELPYVALRTSDRTWTVSLQRLGARPQLERAVQEAWKLGRSGDFRTDLRTRAQLLWRGYRIVPALELDPGAMLIYLRQVAKQVGRPARQAQVWVAGLQTRSGESETGHELDIIATQEAIAQQTQYALGVSAWEEMPRLVRFWYNRVSDPSRPRMEPIPVSLIFREIAPPLMEINSARERMDVMLGAPIELEYTFQEFELDGSARPAPRHWVIDQATLASWITLERVQKESGTAVEVNVDRDQVAAYVQKLADEIARPPREPRFDYDPKAGILKIVTPGQNGYALDVDAAQALLLRACFSTDRRVVLPVQIFAPRVMRAHLEPLLPLELVSEGETSFRGSTPERLQNIRTATARFHGVAVPARATFSFLEHLGLVTLANGYSESWVIYGDRTVLGPGGGVCQVSTTCFRAAFFAGFPIVERLPHSYRVGWYEPPVGLDAAVFSPIVDMKFQNDSDFPILILTEVDERNAKLYFRFYGKRTGREVSLEGPVTANPVKAGEPVFEEDPSLPPGTRVQVDWPHDGLDVTLYRVIKQNGIVVAREKLFSRYEAWPARFRVGPSRTETAVGSSRG